jgi:fluoroquinolone transport system permease protein
MFEQRWGTTRWGNPRLVATLARDVVVQFRNGFYLVSGFFILIWVSLFSLIPDGVELDAALVVPSFLTLNLVITTFFFVGALVLLEKDEGTLAGLAVTPLRDAEYLWAKLISLVLLAAGESLLIVLPIFGAGFAPAPLLAGTLLVAIVRYDSINEYLLPSTLFVMALMLPLVDLLGIWSTPLVYLHPLQPALVLMRAAFGEAPGPGSLIYGWLGAPLWFAVSFRWAQRRFARFVVSTTGGAQ